MICDGAISSENGSQAYEVSMGYGACKKGGGKKQDCRKSMMVTRMIGEFEVKTTSEDNKKVHEIVNEKGKKFEKLIGKFGESVRTKRKREQEACEKVPGDVRRRIKDLEEKQSEIEVEITERKESARKKVKTELNAELDPERGALGGRKEESQYCHLI